MFFTSDKTSSTLVVIMLLYEVAHTVLSFVTVVFTVTESPSFNRSESDDILVVIFTSAVSISWDKPSNPGKIVLVPVFINL